MTLLRRFRLPKKAAVSILFLWGVTACVAAYLVLLADNQLQAHNNAQAEKAKSHAYLISQHFRHGFENADFLLRAAVDEYRAVSNDGRLAEARKEELRSYLKERATLIPGIASYTIIRSNGRRLVGIVNKDDTDLSQRPYFLAIKNQELDFHITPVEDGLASGKNGIHVARKIPNAKGDFNGVVVINLPAKDVFYEYLSGLSSPEGTAIQLRTADRVYLDYPANNAAAVLEEEIKNGVRKTEEIGLTENQLVTEDGQHAIIFKKLYKSHFFTVLVYPGPEHLSEDDYFIPLPYILAGGLLLSALFGTILIVNWEKLKEAHKTVIRTSGERQILIKKLHTVVEEERKSIAHDIHDVMNATLIAIKLDAHAIQTRLSKIGHDWDARQYAIDRASAIERSAKELYTFCRSIVARLRPEALDIHGIKTAIDTLVSEFNSRNPSCHILFSQTGDWRLIGKDASLAIFRIVQESLSNIQKYANASHVGIDLLINEISSTASITIKDDGVGLPKTHQPGFGLLGIKERAEALGGKCSIESAPNNGVSVNVTLPC